MSSDEMADTLRDPGFNTLDADTMPDFGCVSIDQVALDEYMLSESGMEPVPQSVRLANLEKELDELSASMLALTSGLPDGLPAEVDRLTTRLDALEKQLATEVVALLNLSNRLAALEGQVKR